MLEHTFVHIQGIGPKTEQKIWRSGIRTWHDFLRRKGTILSAGRDGFVSDELELSVNKRRDIKYFTDRLSSGEMWRLFDECESSLVYLDIETSGGGQGIDEITVIGIYDGRKVRTFVNGKNLDEFEIAICDYDMVVTFNGTCFDLPVIRRWFRNISLPPAHIDLRFLLKRLGYTGGLKKIEKSIGIVRNSEIDGMDGYEAVLLWKAYEWGDEKALETLIKYNTADILNLKPLMAIGYGEMKKKLLPWYK